MLYRWSIPALERLDGIYVPAADAVVTIHRERQETGQWQKLRSLIPPFMNISH